MIRILLFALLISGTGAGLALAAASDDQNARLIIVSFRDRGITAPTTSGPGDFYSSASADSGTGYHASAWGRRLTARLAADYRLDLVTDWPIQALGIHCAVYRAATSQSVDDVLQALAKDKRVDGAQRMNNFHALQASPQLGALPGLSDIQLGAAHRLSTGRSVRIAVIDTGIDGQHPDLAGQVLESRDFVSEAPGGEKDVHGTAVAGIIAARGDNHIGIVGVAPDAKLLALRACWPAAAGEASAACNTLTLARALDAVVRLRPEVLNLSLTGPADPLLNALLTAVLKAGVIVVAAEPDAGVIRSNFPTAEPNVIRVKSAEDRHAVVDAAAVTAPGYQVLTTFPGGDYEFISGSSFAAAHVSGIVALLLELRPGSSAAELSRLLQNRTTTPGTQQSFRSVTDERTCALMFRLGRSSACEASERAAPLSDTGARAS